MRAARARVAAVGGALVGGLLTLTACDRVATNLSGGVGPEAGLLRGKLPVVSRAVTHVVRLTDGIAATTGDPARTDLTAELSRPGSRVTWDLGAETPVRCVLIDADGDDTYSFSLSSDGKDFLALFRAGPDEDRGQQLRAGRELTGTGRYLKLSAAGGSAPWSVSEVSAWRDCPTKWPPLAMQKGTPDDEAVRLKLWAFAALAIAYVLTYRKRAPDWAKLLGVAPAGVGIALVVQVAELWPPSSELAARLAGVAGAIVAAVGVRWAVGRKMAPPTGVIVLLLGLALAGLGCGRTEIQPSDTPACNGAEVTDWQATFDAPFAEVVAVDAAGSPFTAKTETVNGVPSVMLSKLNGAGGAIWSRNLGAGSLAALGQSSRGGLFAAAPLPGTEHVDPKVRNGGTPRSRAAVSHVDDDGQLLWRTELDDDGGDLGPTFVAETASGDVVVAGPFGPDMPPAAFANPPGRFAFFLARLSSTGTLLWERHVTDQGSAQAFVVDVAGRVGAVVELRSADLSIDGVTFSSPLGAGTVLVWFDATGKAIEGRDLIDDGGERVTGAALDGNGRLFFVGVAEAEVRGALNSEVFVSAFDDARPPAVWEQEFPMGSLSADPSLSLDPCGRVVVVVPDASGAAGLLVARLTREGVVDTRRMIAPTLGNQVNSTAAASGGVFVTGVGGADSRTSFVASLALATSR